MDLARALTKRKKRPEINVLPPTRVPTIKHNGPVHRNIISPPIELLSTTNVLALNAPSLYHSPSSATSTSDDSDGSLELSPSSRGTTPDNSSIDLSSGVVGNHLSTYFKSPGRSSSPPCSHRQSQGGSNEADAPSIPSRALSHTRKSHQAIARQRSISSSVQPLTTIYDAANTRSSVDIFSSKPDVDHPFGAELEQVNELAEEIGARNVMILDEEEEYLMSHGLLKFAVEEYMDEIQGLFGGSFGNPFGPFNAGWI